MKTVLHHKDSKFNIWVGCDQKRTLIEVYAKVDGGIRHFINNYEPSFADKIETEKSLSLSLSLENIKNEALQDGFLSKRPYEPAQACDGSITSCALALYLKWCKVSKVNPDILYKKAYPEEKAPSWQEVVSFAEWQGVKYPVLWDKKNIDGMLESLTEINYHSLRSQVEDHLERCLRLKKLKSTLQSDSPIAQKPHIKIK